MAKRRKLPEEDIEAAVAEMLASPITRANLNFLKPEFASEPEPTPAPVEPTPARAIPIPMGVVATSLPQAWVAEQIGTVFDARRVRPIQRATDALSAVELSVYRLLWSQQPGPGGEPHRLAQFSLNRIATETKVNIKTVRELLPRLTDKGFIEVAIEADAKLGIPTTYRVWSESALVARMEASGRRHVVKTGKGVFYAHPAGHGPAGPVHPHPMGSGSTPQPVITKPMGRGEKPMETLAQVCQAEFGVEPDPADLAALIEECRQRAQASGSPLTEPELVYFAESKARVIARASNIRNHFAVWRKALPECFARR